HPGAHGPLRRSVPALPARLPRQGGRRRGHRRPRLRGLGRGGEPPARPEGPADLAARPSRRVHGRPRPAGGAAAMSDSRRALAQAKTPRQQRIVQLHTHREVSSQSQLAQLLTAEGIEVTQATLSRDLVELQAEKVCGSSGSLVYRLPPEGAGPLPPGTVTVNEQSEARPPTLLELMYHTHTCLVTLVEV